MPSNPFRQNKYSIYYILIDCLIAGVLVIGGALSTGNVDKTSMVAACGAALVVFLTKFKDYWKSEKSDYCPLFF